MSGSIEIGETSGERTADGTLPIRIARQSWVGDLVDKSLNRHENYREVGTLYLRVVPFSIRNR